MYKKNTLITCTFKSNFYQVILIVISDFPVKSCSET